MRFYAVVVPVDFSDASLAAIRYALQLSSLDAIDVIHVTHEDAAAIEVGITHTPPAPAVSVREIRTWLADNHLPANLRLTVSTGQAAERIAAFVDKIRADLVVIPSHRRRGVSRLLIGSVAEQVLRRTRCPVLVLPRRGSDPVEATTG